jgi:hypothetical protein
MFDASDTLPLDSGQPRLGTYLTNETFLYRVSASIDGVVELEDCYRLDVVSVPARDLRDLGLRVVTPGPG